MLHIRISGEDFHFILMPGPYCATTPGLWARGVPALCFQGSSGNPEDQPWLRLTGLMPERLVNKYITMGFTLSYRSKMPSWGGECSVSAQGNTAELVTRDY